MTNTHALYMLMNILTGIHEEPLYGRGFPSSHSIRAGEGHLRLPSLQIHSFFLPSQLVFV